MPNDQLKEYLATDTGMNALKAVPDVVMESLKRIWSCTARIRKRRICGTPP